MSTAYEIVLKRDRWDKLSANTTIPLGAERRELRIHTSKSGNGVVSCSADVVQRSEDGLSYQQAFALSKYSRGDYCKTLAHVLQARATEKTIRTMHAAALAGIDAVLTEARAHYGIVTP